MTSKTNFKHTLKQQDIPEFLNICFSQVKTGGELIFVDNKYVEGSSTKISRIDKQGNQYQLRRLASGAEYEVIKNFPSQLEFSKMIHSKMENFEWIELDYYWIAKFKSN